MPATEGHQGEDRSFILIQRSGVSRAEANRLMVVLNWFTEAKAKMAAR